jgi:hypothetical protein
MMLRSIGAGVVLGPMIPSLNVNLIDACQGTAASPVHPLRGGLHVRIRDSCRSPT